MKQIIQYDSILNMDYFYETYKLIRKNTKNKEKCFKYELFLSSNLIFVLNSLKNRKYVHGKYNIFLIKDPKYRIIMSEKLPDKLVNHLVSKYFLFPCIDKRLLSCNVATRVDKGTKEAYFLMKKYLNLAKSKEKEIYVLKCDIHKYFYSISHPILYQKLEKIIEDEDILKLLKQIIDTTDRSYVNEGIENLIQREIKEVEKKNISQSEKISLIHKLKQIPLYKKGFGLPIGNMSSQILAIYYLNDLDHYIKEQLKIKYYIRYMDDFILIHSDKDYLKYCLKQIEIYLKRLDLKLNNKTNIYNMRHGVTFLGYRFLLKNKKLIIKVKNDSKKRIIKKYKTLLSNDKEKFLRVKASYKGYLEIANSKQLIEKLNRLEER